MSKKSSNPEVQLEASLDISGVKEGLAGISTAAGGMAAAVGQAGEKAEVGMDKLTRAEGRFAASIQRATANLKALGKSGAEKFEFLAETKGLDPSKMKPFVDQFRAAEIEAAKVAAAMQRTGLSAKEMAFAVRGVPAQFTDIATSLAAGQTPLTVLLQQGGQLKDMFGGIGAAAKAIGGYVLGLINPVTLTIAAAAGIGYAFSQGAKEARDLNKTLILTGNAAGTSVGQLQAMASGVSAATGATKGLAVEALNQIAGIGQVASGNLALVSRAAINMQRATGKAIGETIKEFEELGKAPAAASEKLSEKYNYLTAAVYRQIKALEEQGRAAEAAALAQKTYADAMLERTPALEENLGSLEKTWRNLGDTAKAAWDFMLGIGRKSSLKEKLDVAEAALRNAQAGFKGASKIPELQAAVVAAKAALDADEAQAKAKEQTNIKEKAGIEWAKEGNKYLSERAKLEKEILRIRTEGAIAGASEIDIQQRVNKAREEYDKGISAAGAENSIAAAKSYAKRYGDFYKQELDNFRLATEDYIEKMAALEHYALGVERKAITSEKPTTDAERIKKSGRLAEIDRQILDVTRKQIQAVEDAAEKSQKVLESMAVAAGKSLSPMEQAGREFAAKWGETMRRAATDGNDAVLQAGQAVWAAMAGDAEFKAAKQNFDALFANLETQLEEVRAIAERDGGLLAGISASAQADEIRAKLLPAIREAKQEMNKAAGESLVNKKTVAESERNIIKITEDGDKTWRKFTDQIEQSLTDSLMRGFESGKGFGESFVDSLKNMLKTAALKFAVQMVVDPVTGSMRSLVGGGASTTAGMFGNSGSLSNTLSAGGSLYNFATGNMSGGAYGAFAMSGVGQTLGLSSASTLAAGGSEAALFGAEAGLTSLGTAVPYVAAALVVASALGLFGGKGKNPDDYYRFSGLANDATAKRSGWTGGPYGDVYDFYGAGGSQYKAMPDDMRAAMDKSIGSLFDSMEKAAKGAGFATEALDSLTVATHSTGKGIEADVTNALTEVADAIALSVLPSLKDFQVQGEALSATFSRVTSDMGVVKELFSTLGQSWTGGQAGAKIAEDVIGQFGNSETLKGAWSAYFGAFYSEAEKAALATKQVSDALALLDLSMPASTEAFRALVQAQDLTTASGQKTFAALMGLAPAFSTVMTAAEQAAQRAAALASTKSGLEIDLMNARGDTAGATAAQRAAKLAALDESLRPLQQQVFDALDAADAAKAAAEAQAAAAAAAQQAADAQMQAQEALRASWQSTADSIMETVRKLRGDLLGESQTFAQAQAGFAIATAAARAGDQTAANTLPQLASALVDLGSKTSATGVEQAILAARTAASLEETVRSMAGFGVTVPAFASGGMHAGGLRLVGENGPEVEATGPSRIYNLDQFRDAVQGGNLSEELRALRAEIAALRAENGAENRAIVTATSRTARLLDRVMPDGDALAVRTAA